MREKTFVKILRIFPMLIMMAVIFAFSAMEGDASADASGMFLKAVAKLVEELSHHGLSASALASIHIIIRKIAHFSEYFALGMTIMFAFYRFFRKPAGGMIFSEIIAILYACTDEYHQYFVPGRFGTIGDVIIDSCGALTGIVIYYLLWKYFQTEKRERLSRKAAKRLKKKAQRKNKKDNLIV